MDARISCAQFLERLDGCMDAAKRAAALNRMALQADPEEGIAFDPDLGGAEVALQVCVILCDDIFQTRLEFKNCAWYSC